MGVGFNHTAYPIMNVSPSCKVVFSIEKNRKWYFHHFVDELLSPSKNIILNGHSIIYPLKQKYICDYNIRCFMSRGLVFDDIIMNMIRNKALECHEEEVGVFLQIFITKTYLYRGPLQYFY